MHVNRNVYVYGKSNDLLKQKLAYVLFMIDSSLGQFFFILCDTHSDLCTRVDHISQSRDVFEVPSPWERFQYVEDRPCTENINVFALEFFKISFFTLKLVKKN